VTQRGERPYPPAEERFRIVSANLWNGAADPRAFADLVAELEADAVATQEMAPEQADALARVLPHGLLEPARDYTGMGIALRAPARVRRIGLPCRDARVADVHWAGPSGGRLELEVLNLHVQAPHLAPRWGHWHHRRGQLRGIVRHLEAARSGAGSSSATSTPRPCGRCIGA
jgi:endonuclease/exonuclease/phosphatase (EEP) superfamily protein YafD